MACLLQLVAVILTCLCRRFFVSFRGRRKWGGGEGGQAGNSAAETIIQEFFRYSAAVRNYSWGGPRAELRHRNNNFVQNLFCFKLDAMSVPEALATTIRILLMFSIALAHQWGPRPWVRSAPSGTPRGHPWAPLGAYRSAGGGGTRPEFRNPNNNPIIVSILPGGAELIREAGKGVHAIPPNAEFSIKDACFSKTRHL